ncbi:WD repeat-containing protein 97 isoform X1 [Zootoca vivipara]|uniref:WD repeat-containing protein 97 isoform X1 n=1 Tax=Zootoca vivipara TaxID=8524 RepID=UPI00293BA860|nr:WD repeat-containing protein 97 isoform X1 [Zootoca vivipara]
MMEAEGRSSTRGGRRKRLRLCSEQVENTKEVEAAAAEKQNEPQPPPRTRQSKPYQYWTILQKRLRRALDMMKKEDLKPIHLSHGLQHLSRSVLGSPVRCVTYHLHGNRFVVLDSENKLHFLREDGSYKSCLRAPAPMVGILYASMVNQFVAWDEGGLQVLDSDFQLLSQVRSAVPIRCGIYSENLNRILTAGEGNLTIWDFRYGCRSLQCRAILREGLGPGDVFSHIALDTSSFQPQRCFASSMTGAAAWDVSNGKLLSFKMELHSRAITDITYCEVIGCAITASRDTTIKVWDKNWHIQTVFVGHTGPVVAVTIYPQRAIIFSASQDGTIRTWNLNTIDQVDQVHLSEPVETLKAVTLSHIVSISGSSLTLWKINKLYSLYTPVGCPIRRINCVNLEALGNFPVRALCICQDSTVRMVDAQSGVIISILFLDSPRQGLELAYCLPRETLFVLMEDGAVLWANSAQDPMQTKKSLPGSTWESDPCCLMVYSHVLDPEKAYSQWLDVLDCKGYKKQWLKLPDKNRFLLILGHKTGFLTVVEWFLARNRYKVEAHGSQAVTALAEYPTQMCIISAGADRTVKMWRVFPYTTECLVPLLSFSCASPALHLCSLGETLAVAFQDPQTATYSVVYYNLMKQTRSEHKPEDDAQDNITGLCCCPNLKLVASSSRDGSVKIWDIENKLLRHLKMNTIPESLAFANHWGDLLVGLERHVFLIHHNKYLPNHYKMKLLCARFLEPLKGIPLPISDAHFEALVKENVRRLKQDQPLEEIESPVPGGRRMALQESGVLRDIHARTEGLSQMADRDQDLELVQKGKASVAKKLRPTKEMKEEAFEKYLKIFYKPQPKIEIPEEDTFNADEVLEVMRQAKSLSELYGPDGMFLGCFPPPISLERPETLEDTSSPAEESPLAVLSTAPSVSEIKEAVSPVPPVRVPVFGLRRSKSEQIGMAQKGKKPPKPRRRRLPPPVPSPLVTAPEEIPEPSSSSPLDEAETFSPSTRRPSPGLILSGMDTRGSKVKIRRATLKKDLGAIQESEMGASVTPPSQLSSTPSFPGEPIKSEKSVVFKEFPSPDKSQGSPSSPEKSQGSPYSPDKIQGSPSSPDKIQGSPSSPDKIQGSPSSPDKSQGSPSSPGKSQGSPSSPGKSQGSPSSLDKSQGPFPLPAKSQESHPALPVRSQELSPFSPVRSQESSPKSLGSISRMKSQTSSVIIKGFFPERPPSGSKDYFRLQELESHQAPLPRLSSGFIPNSVAALQFHSEEMLAEEREEREERLMGVVEPETESPSRTFAMWKVDEDEEPRTQVSEETGIIKPSRKQTDLPEIFLTQLDESQYPEQKKEPPFFVLPFLDMQWFQDLFPEGFPPDMTLNEFLTKMMASLVVTRDFGQKAELVAAILSLKDEMGIRMKELVCSTFIQVLNKRDDMPSLRERKHRKFILGTLQALVKMDKNNKDLMVELMAFYLQAYPPDKVIIYNLMKQVGVQDPHSYFTKELSSWPVEASDAKETVRGACDQWLGGKMRELKEHRAQLLAQKVPSRQGYYFKPFQKQKRRSTMETESKMSSPEIFQEEQSGSSVDQERRLEGKYSPESYKEVGKDLGEKEQAERRFLVEEKRAWKEESRQEPEGVDVTDNTERSEMQEPGSLEAETSRFGMQPVCPVDAIHYFAEKQLEKEMEEMKKQLVSSELIALKDTPKDTVKDTPKDTVMALPPIKKKRAILRLGETNAMLRKRIPERIFCPYIFSRYLMKGFAPFVKLPLPRINLDPFPPILGRPASPKSFTAMQQLVRKYFIPKFSYADNYP